MARTNKDGQLEVSVVESLAIIQPKVTSQVVEAGSYFTVGVFYAKDGIKRVTAGIKSDASHSLQLYATHESEDGATQYGTDGGGAITASMKAIDYNLKTARLRVSFKNEDTVAHTISAECIGWAN